MILEDGKFRQPSERRFAAAALGRLGDPKAIPAIFDVIMFEKNDRFLEHALTYALIEIADPKATAEGLTHKYPHVRRAAMIALDQMPNGKLEAKFVLAELDSKEADLKETAWWIAGHHPEWGELLAGYFRERLAKIEKMTPPERDTLTARLVPFFKSAEIRKVAGDALHGTIDPSSQRSLLRSLARSGLKAFPAEWNGGVQQALVSRTEDVLRDAIAMLRAVPPSAADHAAISTKVLQHHRLLQPPLGKEFEYSLRATAPIGSPLTREEADAVIPDVHKDKFGTVRAAASELLGRASMPTESLIALAEALKAANPLELAKLIAVFAKSTDAKVGFALIATLSDPAVRPLVRLEQVKPVFEKYPAEVKAKAEALYALLAEDRKEERTKLEKLAASLPTGDARRGQAVFNGAKAACASCHKLGYVGGTLGPDLTRIGGIRSERDLLEAIVLPSASFVRSYEPFRVVTVDGKVFNGILKKDAPDEVVLAPAADQLVRIPREDIEAMAQSTVSVMPAGLDQQLTPQDLADLVAFLKANTR